jgi:ketosteroid isomerase-like protein/uncharacterized glyoxalase superfamily protein PhnB
MENTVLAPVDVSAIRATIQPWVRACLDRDWDGLLALCTDDVAFLPPDEPIVAGDQLRPWLNNYPVMKTFEVEFDQIEGQDQLAVARGHFTMTVELPGSTAPLGVNGKFVDQFRRDPQGKWRYATVIWNSNLPSPLRGTAPTAAATPLQVTGIMPSLTVDDIGRSVTFFEGLGFAVTDRWEEGGVLQGVMLQAGTAMIGLSQDDWQKGRDRVKGVGFRTYMETNQSVDELADRAVKAGITLAKPPHDTEWGTRAFQVTTAEGFTLTISSAMKPA